MNSHAIIFNDQDLWRFWRLVGNLRDWCSRFSNGSSNGQTEMKATSVARCALQAQVPALQFDQAIGDYQAQSRAFHAFARITQAVEGFENSLLFFPRNPRPVIAHFHKNFPFYLRSEERRVGRESSYRG